MTHVTFLGDDELTLKKQLIYDEEIKIYNPLGQIIYTGSPQDIPVLEGKGLYIIYIGKSAVKILL